MSDFSGTLRVDGVGSQPVPARLAVGSGRLGVRVGDVEVGSWPLADLVIQIRPNGVDLTVGEDRFALDLTDTDTFVRELEVGRVAGSVKPLRVERRWPRALLARRPKVTVPSTPALVAAVALTAIVAAALYAPTVVGSVGILLGILLLCVGSLAVTEPAVALRIPYGLPAAFLLVTGVGMVAIGMVVVVFG